MIEFYKYQGCGNDFILIDNRKGDILLSEKEVEKLCDRRFGIGADGLMLLCASSSHDFEMMYYNNDGKESSFCGNGGRCIVQFFKDLNMGHGNSVNFTFRGVIYSAEMLTDMRISLNMQEVSNIITSNQDYILDTGSPHYIHFSQNIESESLIDYARGIRYSRQFPEGINVNLVEKLGGETLFMRTYERGVEDETYSCGTGVTAAAIAYHYQELKKEGQQTIHISTKGGSFKVSFNYQNGKYQQVYLIGPAVFVFKGLISL